MKGRKSTLQPWFQRIGVEEKSEPLCTLHCINVDFIRLVFETSPKNVGISRVCHHALHEHVKKHPVPSRSGARRPDIFLNHMASCGFSYRPQYGQKTSFPLLENFNIFAQKKSLPQTLPSGLLSYKISRQIQWFLYHYLHLWLVNKRTKISCLYSKVQWHFSFLYS